MTEFIKHFISSAQCKSVVTFLAKLRFLQVCEIHTTTHILSYTNQVSNPQINIFRAKIRCLNKKKSQVLLFLGSVGHFFVFIFLVFKKKNVGSGLILGSVGLRQYNNFFFWPYFLDSFHISI